MGPPLRRTITSGVVGYAAFRATRRGSWEPGRSRVPRRSLASPSLQAVSWHVFKPTAAMMTSAPLGAHASGHAGGDDGGEGEEVVLHEVCVAVVEGMTQAVLLVSVPRLQVVPEKVFTRGEDAAIG
jgi:hypothetical protein